MRTLLLTCCIIVSHCVWTAEAAKETEAGTEKPKTDPKPEKPKPRHGGIIDNLNTVEAVYDENGVTLYAIETGHLPTFLKFRDKKITKIVITIAGSASEQAEGEVTVADDAKSMRVNFKGEWKDGTYVHCFFGYEGGHFAFPVDLKSEYIKNRPMRMPPRRIQRRRPKPAKNSAYVLARPA